MKALRILPAVAALGLCLLLQACGGPTGVTYTSRVALADFSVKGVQLELTARVESSTDGRHLCLDFEIAGKVQDGGGCGYNGGMGYGYDAESIVGDQEIYFGPVPPTAMKVQYSAAGNPTETVATKPLPHLPGVKAGSRYFVLMPARANQIWDEALFTANGKPVKPADF